MKEKILEIIKQEEGKFISGQEISSRLGITRAAIWKSIRQLRQEGYGIEAVTHKGYRLLACPDRLTYDEVKDDLHTQTFARSLLHFDVVASTNREARKLAESGAPEGAVVTAEEQSSGKGRMGRGWYSPRGEGIWMSIILRPALKPDQAAALTRVALYATGECLREAGADVKLKMPNDIYLHGKKVCGALTEISGELNILDYVIIGIGINVRQRSFPEFLAEKAVSLRMAGIDISRKALFCSLMDRFEKRYRLFEQEPDVQKREQMIAAWQAL